MADKTFIAIKRGLLEKKHREAMGARVWLYMYMIDNINWETGFVNGWKDEAAATDFDMNLRTLQEHRQDLDKLGYITCNQKQYHLDIEVHNWTNPREYSGKTYNPKTQGTPNTAPSKPQGSRKSRTPTSNSKLKDSTDKVSKPDLDAMVFAFEDVTQIDHRVNYAHLAKYAKSLVLAGYTPEQVRTVFSRGGAWYETDWRGKKGQLPSPADVTKQLSVLLAQPVKTFNDALAEAGYHE